MRKRIVAMALVLVMVIPVAACAIEPSTEEIVDGVIEALDEVSAYQFDVDMTMDIAGEAEGEAFEMTMATDFSGALDLENRRMRADISMRMTIPGEDEVEMEMEMYLIDDMGYIMMDVPEMGPTWMKSEISEAYLEETGKQISQTESQIELLETAEVKVIGSEKVRGVDCYVLQLTTPDMEQLWQMVMQQQEIAEVGMPDVGEEFIQEMFRNFSVKQWVAKDTYFLTRAEIEMTVELTPEAMGFPEEEGEMTMDITMTLLVYNYNESVSIVLPLEAEEAPDVTQEQRGAAETELSAVQTAVNSMMVDNELWELPNPVTVATNDMSAFPDTSVCGIDKIQDTEGNAYVRGQDKDGHVLYQHDITADNAPTGLVNYVATQYTEGTYTVDKDGTVTQVTTGDE